MFYVCKPRVISLALISFVLALSTVQGISVANAATPSITRALPVGSTLYSLPCSTPPANGQLGRIVTVSGVPTAAMTPIGSGTIDAKSTNCPVGATYNPVTQTAYWVTPKVISGITKQHLFSIDVSTGISTYVAEIRADISGRGYASSGATNIPVIYGITFDADGNLYAMIQGNATEIWIAKVTLNALNTSDNGKIIDSSAKKLITSPSNPLLITGVFPYNFAFNPSDNKFYSAAAFGVFGSGPHLYEIDPITGTTIDKGARGNTSELFIGMQFDGNGVMWGGYDAIYSATVAGWTSPTDLQRTSANTSYEIDALLFVPFSSTSPSAPTLNTVTGGDRSISVAFTAGANGGASITDYEYSLNGGTYTSAATTTSPFTITSGISGRTSYSVALKARNSVGLGSASGSLSATTTDSSADASEAATAAAEAARVAAAEAARVAAVNAAIAAAAAKRATEQKEMSELLAVLPSIAGLALNIGDLTNSLLVKQKCVNGKKTKAVSYGSKCPKGYVKRK
jgi:hypothetical protein